MLEKLGSLTSNCYNNLTELLSSLLKHFHINIDLKRCG